MRRPRRGNRPARGAPWLLGAVVLLLPLAAVVRLPSFAPLSAALVGIPSDALALPAGVAVSPIPAGAPVDLEVALEPSNASALAALDAALIDPESPEYHHFLTEHEFESQFAPAPAEVARVAAYFAPYGGREVGLTPDRLGLSIRIAARGLSEALGVRPVSFPTASGARAMTSLGTARVPSSLRGSILGIDGLTDLGRVGASDLLSVEGRGSAPLARGPGAIVVNSTSGQWWFTGTDYAQAYGMDRFYSGPNATFANSSAVATILMSGYNATENENLPPFDPNAVSAYFNATYPSSGWPYPSVSGVPVSINGVSPPLPGPQGVLSDDTGNVDENSIDLEMAGSFAPGATLVNFYFGASLFENSPNNATGYSDTADDFAETLSSALSYSYGNATLRAVTNSYGLPDLSDSLWNSELQHAAAIGVTVIAASGDQGDAPNKISGFFQGPDPTWPATAAFNSSGTIAVGGITVNLTGTPSGSFSNGALNASFDPSISGFSEQTAWYDVEGPNASGSEGGASTVVPEPPWQLDSAAQPTIVNSTVTQGLDALGRAEPDVAFPANDTLAFLAVVGGTVEFDLFEGTSIAAPIFAGMLAELAAVQHGSFGFLDPQLYRIASYFAANPGSSDPFEDITTGHNYLFSAGPGWDAVTGWGTLDPVRLLAATANRTEANYSYTGPEPGLPPLPSGSSGSGYTITAELIVLILVVGVLAAVGVAFVLGGGRRPPVVRGPPPGTYTPVPGGPPPPFGTRPAYSAPPATFLCPYCGSVRPAEPVRCPSCGAL